jgi:stage V sporulation protein K
MKEERTNLLADSFEALVEDMQKSLTENDNETVQYTFLRVFRLLQRTEEAMDQAIQTTRYHDFKEIRTISHNIRKKLSEWKAVLAYKSEVEGENLQSEIDWLASLSFHATPEHYIQYGHAVLKNKNLYVNREIEENMKFVTNFNVSEVKVALKRARLAVKSAVTENGIEEATGYFLTWIDLMEKAIVERLDLVEAISSPRQETSLAATLDELHQLIGMETVKRKIKEISNWVTFTQMRREENLITDEISMHMVFSGNPGTGKTTVARIIAKILKALGVLKKGHLVEVGRSDLVAEYVGQTAIKTMKKIKEAEHGVLFIDEAYSLTRSGGNDFGIEAIDTLVKAMEDSRKNLVVILAGYPNEMKQFIEANPGLYSRFKYHIDFPDYTIEELLEIHEVLLKEKQYKLTEGARPIVKRLIRNVVTTKPTQHGNGRLVRNLIEDEILNKAAYVVENKQNNLPTGELDVIDETIMKMVEIGSKTSEDRYKLLQNKAILG